MSKQPLSNNLLFSEKQNIDIEDFIDTKTGIEVEDYAQSKKVLELCNHPEQLTFKNFEGYNGMRGYCATHTPAHLTVDLGESYDLGLIQFLLMDLPEDKNQGIKERRYYFRVLVSDYYQDNQIIDKDKIEWKVLYDSQNEGFRNWQFLRITDGIKARFIRIHCIRNDKNNGFHIVRLRAYSKEVADKVDYNAIEYALHTPDNKGFVIDKYNLSRIHNVYSKNIEIEIGDGFPLSKRIYDIANLVKQISTNEYGKNDAKFLQFNIEEEYLMGINKTVLEIFRRVSQEQSKTANPFGVKSMVNISGTDITKILQSIADDIYVIEKNSDGMERILLDPVNIQLYKSNKDAIKWGVINVVVFLVLITLYFFS